MFSLRALAPVTFPLTMAAAALAAGAPALAMQTTDPQAAGQQAADQQAAAPAPTTGPVTVPNPVTVPVPATSTREAPVDGILYIYGNERCPTDKEGNEIVVCVRRSASERYRLPKDLRPSSIKPQYQSWAERQNSTLNVGADSIGSCSAVGSGGATGCARQAFEAARAENKARKAEKQAEDDAIHPN